MQEKAMKKRIARATTVGIAVATCIGLSGCAVYDGGYYPAAVPASPVYVYPRAYYYGPAYPHFGYWHHRHHWRHWHRW
jgi:hypothetical protein